MTVTALQDLEFTRDYNVTVDRLWQAITQPDQIVQWFGPEGVRIDNCSMDFSKTGPWMCDMVGKESGDHFKVSGQITHVRPPSGAEGSVGLTWAWHGENDQRGPESHVIFEVSSHGNKARFRLIHRELENAEMAQNHSRGWLSTLTKLDAFMAS